MGVPCTEANLLGHFAEVKVDICDNLGMAGELTVGGEHTTQHRDDGL